MNRSTPVRPPPRPPPHLCESHSFACRTPPAGSPPRRGTAGRRLETLLQTLSYGVRRCACSQQLLGTLVLSPQRCGGHVPLGETAKSLNVHIGRSWIGSVRNILAD